jgi:hypothetical protein
MFVISEELPGNRPNLMDKTALIYRRMLDGTWYATQFSSSRKLFVQLVKRSTRRWQHSTQHQYAEPSSKYEIWPEDGSRSSVTDTRSGLFIV